MPICNFKFLSNLLYAIKFENCERDEMDLLHITRDTQWWWWNLKIKRNAKFAKWGDVEVAKKSQLCLSIVFDRRCICIGGIYKSCSP
jgi:hypothetical protein